MVRALAGDSTMTRGLPVGAGSRSTGSGWRMAWSSMSVRGSQRLCQQRPGPRCVPDDRDQRFHRRLSRDPLRRPTARLRQASMAAAAGGLGAARRRGDLLLGPEALGLALGERDGADQDHDAGTGDAQAGPGVVPQGDHRRQDEQRDQVHDLDERVERRAGGVLEGVAHGVADDGRGVGIGSLASLVAVLDVLLGVVPRPTRVRQEVGHELPGEDGGGEERAQGEVVDAEARRSPV